MFTISVPAPCHQDWETMSAEGRDRFCSACSKTVIDFTAMTEESVLDFFTTKKEQKVCGRFRSEQLNHTLVQLPLNVLQLKMPRWKHFLTVCLIVFGTTLFSCNTKLQEKVNAEKSTIGVLLVLPKTEKTPAVCITGDTVMNIVQMQSIVTGDVEIMATPPVEKPVIDSLKDSIATKILKPVVLPAPEMDTVLKSAGKQIHSEIIDTQPCDTALANYSLSSTR